MWAAFGELKKKCLKATMLEFTDFHKPFLLETDALLKGLGIALSKKQEDGWYYPVAYVMVWREMSWSITHQSWSFELWSGPWLSSLRSTFSTRHSRWRLTITSSPISLPYLIYTRSFSRVQFYNQVPKRQWQQCLNKETEWAPQSCHMEWRTMCRGRQPLNPGGA